MFCWQGAFTVCPGSRLDDIHPTTIHPKKLKSELRKPLRSSCKRAGQAMGVRGQHEMMAMRCQKISLGKRETEQSAVSFCKPMSFNRYDAIAPNSTEPLTFSHRFPFSLLLSAAAAKVLLVAKLSLLITFTPSGCSVQVSSRTPLSSALLELASLLVGASDPV